MKHNNSLSPGEGRLPASAPLANPYVPFQRDDPPKYEPDMAIIRGTLYPGLDLPFLGMENNTKLTNSLLSELQGLSFAIQELALYLDTHQDDDEAFTLYQSMQKIYSNRRGEYEKKYGPLTHDNSFGENYQWLRDPWPWEYPTNREV